MKGLRGTGLDSQIWLGGQLCQFRNSLPSRAFNNSRKCFGCFLFQGQEIWNSAKVVQSLKYKWKEMEAHWPYGHRPAITRKHQTSHYQQTCPGVCGIFGLCQACSHLSEGRFPESGNCIQTLYPSTRQFGRLKDKYNYRWIHKLLHNIFKYSENTIRAYISVNIVG